MKSVEVDIHKIARLARISLSDAEAQTFQAQLGQILGYVAQLDELDVSDIEPSTHAQVIDNVVRADVSRPSFTPEQALANAPATSGDQFQVVKVVAN